MDGGLKTFVLKPLIMLGLIACSFAALAQRPQDPRQPNRPVPDDVRTKAPEPVARLTPEEYLIRDVYARLMRYQFAAVQAHQADSGVAAEPDAYLLVALRDLRTRPWTPPRSSQTTAGAGPNRTLLLQKTPLCEGLDPCHVYYDVEWAATGSGAGKRLDQPPHGMPSHYTTYRVALTLGTTKLSYSAAALHYDAGAGTSVTKIVDPAIPDLDGLVNERSPLAVAPWSWYVTTPQYAAVVASIGAPGSQVSVPANAPIGWLPGDDVADPSAPRLAASGRIQAFEAPPAAQPCCTVNSDANSSCIPDLYPQRRMPDATFNTISLNAGGDSEVTFGSAVQAWKSAVPGKLQGLAARRGPSDWAVIQMWADTGPWAEAVWPPEADHILRLYPKLWSPDVSIEFVRAVMTHEIGHTIGLRHMPFENSIYQAAHCNDWRKSIMYAWAPPTVTEFTQFDICAVKKYLARPKPGQWVQPED